MKDNDKQVEIILEIATFVQEEDWDYVLERILDLQKIAFMDGCTTGLRIKPAKEM